MDAAQEFFRKAVAAKVSWPTTVNLDGNAASHRALRLLGNEDPKWKSVVVRCCRYLNNVVEQDHRAIKRRCASMLGLKSFKTAAITFAGVELAHRIRKRQFSLGALTDELPLAETPLGSRIGAAAATGFDAHRLRSP